MMLRVKLDENLPTDLRDLIRARGHDAHTVEDEGAKGRPDEFVAALVRDERRILITLDVEFGDLRVYPPKEYAGIVLLRLKRQGKSHLLALAPRILDALETTPIDGRLWVVDDDKIRVRD
jgi:predicted nuclease of predicted toxin-antitoxin system